MGGPVVPWSAAGFSLSTFNSQLSTYPRPRPSPLAPRAPAQARENLFFRAAHFCTLGG